MASVIATTIYLNQQNIKDALLINIAGKQRMLTQKIAKNIFYIYYNPTENFNELTSACDEFIDGLNTLKHGNQLKGISVAPTGKISDQLLEVSRLWEIFYRDVESFKQITSVNPKESIELQRVVSSIYNSNTTLLNNVDKLVTMYTNHSEDKTNFIKLFQYSSGGILFLVFIYSLLQLKAIEAHVDSFMQYSKMLINNEDILSLAPLKLEAESESEIVEVSDTINCFIKKINSAVEYSNEALLQSQKASSKLEELTDEFDTIIDELKDASLISKHLNNSEDIVIESTEELINSTKKLTNLKNELNNLIKSCQEIK
jgi:hypothetical protein